MTNLPPGSDTYPPDDHHPEHELEHELEDRCTCEITHGVDDDGIPLVTIDPTACDWSGHYDIDELEEPAGVDVMRRRITLETVVTLYDDGDKREQAAWLRRLADVLERQAEHETAAAPCVVHGIARCTICIRA